MRTHALTHTNTHTHAILTYQVLRESLPKIQAVAGGMGHAVALTGDISLDHMMIHFQHQKGEDISYRIHVQRKCKNIFTITWDEIYHIHNAYIHEKCRFNNVHIIHELLLIIYFQFKKKGKKYTCIHRGKHGFPPMGWLWLVGSIKWWVSFAKEPCKRAVILQKRRIF